MPRFIVRFMKDVLGENGQMCEVCQTSVELEARTDREAEQKAKEKFCEIHTTHDGLFMLTGFLPISLRSHPTFGSCAPKPMTESANLELTAPKLRPHDLGQIVGTACGGSANFRSGKRRKSRDCDGSIMCSPSVQSSGLGVPRRCCYCEAVGNLRWRRSCAKRSSG